VCGCRHRGLDPIPKALKDDGFERWEKIRRTNLGIILAERKRGEGGRFIWQVRKTVCYEKNGRHYHRSQKREIGRRFLGELQTASKKKRRENEPKTE